MNGFARCGRTPHVRYPTPAGQLFRSYSVGISTRVSDDSFIADMMMPSLRITTRYGVPLPMRILLPSDPRNRRSPGTSYHTRHSSHANIHTHTADHGWNVTSSTEGYDSAHAGILVVLMREGKGRPCHGTHTFPLSFSALPSPRAYSCCLPSWFCTALPAHPPCLFSLLTCPTPCLGIMSLYSGPMYTSGPGSFCMLSSLCLPQAT